VLRSFVSALERPGWALAIMAIAVLFNAFANWVLMFGNLGFPALGIVGTGIATTLAATLMFLGLALVVLCTGSSGATGFSAVSGGPTGRASARCCARPADLRHPHLRGQPVRRLGLLMGLIGAASLAAHAIAIQLASLAFMVPMGIAQAATVRVGRAYGAGSRKGIAMSGWTAFVLGIAFMAMTATIMVTLPYLLISAFLDLNDPANAEVVRLAVLFLAIAALFQIVDGAQAVAAGMLRGLQDTKVPMLYAAIGYWGIGMPSASCWPSGSASRAPASGWVCASGWPRSR
jgi:multidrug resistance protein, MATE family